MELKNHDFKKQEIRTILWKQQSPVMNPLDDDDEQ